MLAVCLLHQFVCKYSDFLCKMPPFYGMIRFFCKKEANSLLVCFFFNNFVCQFNVLNKKRRL